MKKNQDAQGNKRGFLQRLRFFLSYTLFLVLLLEFALFCFCQISSVSMWLPTYSFVNRKQFWADIDESFGVWHIPNRRHLDFKTCYEMEYESNSYGARDRERSRKSTSSRVVVLGDSFIEGLGVHSDDRLSNRLEESSGMEHLNFGTSGHFGITQEALLYEKLASQFEHDFVLLGLLPENDFLDDDLEHGKAYQRNRYRPYYSGDYPNYQLVYFQESMAASQASQREFVPWPTFLLKEFTYSYNFFQAVSRRIRYAISRRNSPKLYSGYSDYTLEQFQRAQYSLESIARLARRHGRLLFVFTIPRPGDFIRFKEEGSLPLQRDMEQLSRDVGFEYADLLPRMDAQSNGDWKDLFLSCDGHWTVHGNAVAQAVLEEQLSLYARNSTEKKQSVTQTRGDGQHGG